MSSVFNDAFIFIRLRVYDMGLDEYWATPCFIFGFILGASALCGIKVAGGFHLITSESARLSGVSRAIGSCHALLAGVCRLEVGDTVPTGRDAAPGGISGANK
jgi:hypothetical protein